MTAPMLARFPPSLWDHPRWLAEPIVIIPEGDLDFATAGPFRSAVADAAADAARGLVVDLSNVTIIDSTGLSALVELHHRFRRANRQLAMVAPAGSEAAVALNLAGLSGHLPIFATRQAACES